MFFCCHFERGVQEGGVDVADADLSVVF